MQFFPGFGGNLHQVLLSSPSCGCRPIPGAVVHEVVKVVEAVVAPLVVIDGLEAVEVVFAVGEVVLPVFVVVVLTEVVVVAGTQNALHSGVTVPVIIALISQSSSVTGANDILPVAGSVIDRRLESDTWSQPTKTRAKTSPANRMKTNFSMMSPRDEPNTSAK